MPTHYWQRIFMQGLSAILLLTVASCVPSEDLSSKYVASLKTELPKLGEVAQQWQPDAYITDIGLEVGSRDAILYQIRISYSSPSTNSTLLVSLEEDNDISTEVFPNTYQPEEPISESSIALDSTEILAIALEQPEITSFLQDEPVCGHLGLKHDPNYENGPPLWHLNIENCHSRNLAAYIVIKPMSGEVVRLVLH